MEEKKPIFLVADDEYRIRTMIRQYIEESGYEAECVSNGEEVLRKIYGSVHYNGLFTDLRMPGMDGITLIRALYEEQINIPTVIVSAFGSIEIATEAFKKGVLDFISKPFSPEEIKEAAKLMLNHFLDLKETANTVKGLIEQKAFSSSLKYLLPLFSQYPSSAIPHFLYGLIKEAMGEFEEAVKHFLASNALDKSYDPSVRKIIEYRPKYSKES